MEVEKNAHALPIATKEPVPGEKIYFHRQTIIKRSSRNWTSAVALDTQQNPEADTYPERKTQRKASCWDFGSKLGITASTTELGIAHLKSLSGKTPKRVQ